MSPTLSFILSVLVIVDLFGTMRTVYLKITVPRDGQSLALGIRPTSSHFPRSPIAEIQGRHRMRNSSL